MAIPTIEELMASEISDLPQYELLEEGPYIGVITNTESRPGKKAPYINVEVTIHQSAGDEPNETGRGRKVWRNVSFSEKAVNMPAGIAQLVQATVPDVPSYTKPEDMPAAIAAAIKGDPIGIEVGHENGYDANSADKIKRDSDGNIIMRESIDQFFEAGSKFVESFEAEATGNDSDLPF